ncbi:ABC transporter ATP-binding protein [Candidatus Saccharibacteria bacterium]|nr:ABC transporter ATP-binding protein [Candidatus Saccharibacteria bacterium]
MEQQAVITTKDLSKRYASHGPFALKDLNITIHEGEVFGFLGPNGAGKSTTIRTLLNFIQPTSGSATILGLDIVKDSLKIRHRIGYLSGDFAAYEKMNGKQFLAYMADLQKPEKKTYVDELVHMFQFSSNKRIGDLSKGNRQKLGIIQAFMHQPELLILDEPTDGLDPLMQEAFYKLVTDTKKQGTTFFISSHNLAEVRKICDRVAIIKEGKLVSQSTISDLAVEASQTFDITFAGKAPLAELRKLKKTKLTSNADGSVSLHVHGELSPLFALLAKHDVQHLATKELNLEEEFMRYYEKRTS